MDYEKYIPTEEEKKIDKCIAGSIEMTREEKYKNFSGAMHFLIGTLGVRFQRTAKELRKLINDF